MRTAYTLSLNLYSLYLMKNEDCSSNNDEDNWSFSALNLGENFEIISIALMMAVVIFDYNDDDDL